MFLKAVLGTVLIVLGGVSVLYVAAAVGEGLACATFMPWSTADSDPKSFAVTCGCAELTKLALVRSPVVTCDELRMLLRSAYEAKSPSVVSALLPSALSFVCAVDDKIPLLHECAENVCPGCCELLIESGLGDPQARDRQDRIAAQLASSVDMYNVVKPKEEEEDAIV
jgi:hypothetical protein